MGLCVIPGQMEWRGRPGEEGTREHRGAGEVHGEDGVVPGG